MSSPWRFFLIRRSSIDGSPVLSNISLFVTLSIQLILMIERTQMSHHEGMQLIHMSSVHYPGLGSAQDGRQHGCPVYLSFNPHGHRVSGVVGRKTLGYPPLYIIVNASITSYSASDVGEFQNRVQVVSINHDILL